jgi:hypothetical protein
LFLAVIAEREILSPHPSLRGTKQSRLKKGNIATDMETTLIDMDCFVPRNDGTSLQGIIPKLFLYQLQHGIYFIWIALLLAMTIRAYFHQYPKYAPWHFPRRGEGFLFGDI